MADELRRGSDVLVAAGGSARIQQLHQDAAERFQAAADGRTGKTLPHYQSTTTTTDKYHLPPPPLTNS